MVCLQSVNARFATYPEIETDAVFALVENVTLSSEEVSRCNCLSLLRGFLPNSHLQAECTTLFVSFAYDPSLTFTSYSPI